MQNLSRQLNKGIVMKTVGEFKKAGLVFVKGDTCKEQKGTTYVAGGWSEYENQGDDDWIDDVVIEFAWRENTGVKPEFNGLIEFTFNGEGCEMREVRSARNINWSIVKKWRPSLNQPSSDIYQADESNDTSGISVDYIDTKQSAIHKAWMDLKGDLKNVRGLEGDDNVVVICLSKVGVFNVGDYSTSEWYVGGSNKHWKVICTIQEFTDYCEKMSAEEKRMDIIGQNGNDGLHYDNTAQQVEALALKRPSEKMKVALKEADDVGGGLHHDIHGIVSDEFPDNGFVPRCVLVPITSLKAKVNCMKVSDKPIFTQAMADANELPPVGSKITLIKKSHELAIDAFLGKDVTVIGWSKNSCGKDVITWEHEQYGVCCGIYSAMYFKPVDARTDREKAIDAALDKIGMHRLAVGMGAQEVLNKLYDAGLLKC